MLDYRPSRRRSKYFTFTLPTLGRNINGLGGFSNMNKTSKIILAGRLAKFAFFGLIALIILMVVLFIWYGRDLPAPGKLIAAQANQSSGIYDRNGVLLFSVYQNQNRIYENLNTIPKYLQQGTIAIEDKNFYSNQGFSITGYLRAIRNIVLLRGLSGGSTLTQQLVKNVLLSSEQTIPRKIKELMLSIQVDRKYTKDQILEMYLNDVPYGGTAIGVQAAAQVYFNKDVKDLDLAQSAFLSGLPQSPSAYSPFSGNKYYLSRTKEVLSAMVSQGYINQKQADSAYKEIQNTQFSQNDVGIKAPHFVMYVKQKLVEQFGEAVVENGGLRVKTTLDYNIEKQAEQIVKDEVAKDKAPFNISNGSAMVTIPKTGEILAMVGSEDYFDVKNDGNFNAATALRQPGSSLKPITYATALARGYTASTLLMDTQTNFKAQDSEKDYIPVNYDGKFRGPVQVRFALANSLNIPAVKMLAMVGIKNVMQNGYNMGIDNWQPTDENMRNVGYSLVLGGRDVRLIDEMEAYGVFANGGQKMPLTSILEVDDSKGNVLYKYSPPSMQRIFSQEISFIISHILLDNSARSMEFGPNSQLVVPGHPSVSVKTGTTNDFKDNWTVGYTPSFVVGVWVGNNDYSQSMTKVASGITGAAPIWNKIISVVLKGKTDEPPQKPDNVVAMQIDAYGGGLPVDGRPTRSEYYIQGTQPTAPSPIYQKIKLSKHQSGKLANSSEINAGDYDTKDYIVFKENDPISTDGKNRWQDGINAWIKQTFAADHPEYYPPTDTSDYQESGNNNNSNPTNTPTPTPTGAPTDTPTPILP